MLNIRYKHILFDLDGTIYDSLFANTKALYNLLEQEKKGHQETVDSLYRFAATPALETLLSLGFKKENFDYLIQLWCDSIIPYTKEVKPFEHIMTVIAYLKEAGCHLGIITSRDRKSASMIGSIASPMPPELIPYFDTAICCDDVKHPKPHGESILKYMQISGAKREDILYIGDTQTDYECAQNAGVAFGLALWGGHLKSSIRCEHYFVSPWDIVNTVNSIKPREEMWFKWAREIQAIGQIGLTYTKDKFDRERFTRLREIALEIMNSHVEVPLEKLKNSFVMDDLYPTPKVDTRGAIFNSEDKILLVKESLSGLWNLPGGWCDADETIFSNTVKEVLEEAGMSVHPLKLVALLDRNRHNSPPLPYGTLKAFVLCQMGPQHFVSNSDETSEYGFFSLDEIKKLPLRIDTTTYEQLQLCFEAHKQDNWIPIVE